MPHPLDLTGDLKEILFNNVVQDLKTRVWFKGRARVATITNGFPVFTGGFQDVFFELSNRVLGDITLSLSRPFLPLQGSENSIKATQIKVQVQNTDGFIATTQDGAVIDPDSIEGGTIYVSLGFDSTLDEFDLFTGRIIGLPTEERGKTIFQVRDTIWEGIKTPLQFENYGNINGKIQESREVNGALINTVVTLENPRGFDYEALAGYALYGEDATIITAVSNSDVDTIGLDKLTIKNAADLGRYFIEFVDDTEFRVTHPDNTILYGNIDDDFESDFLLIKAVDWDAKVAKAVIVGLDTETIFVASREVKIEIQVYWSASGNPVSIIKNLIEKGLAQNWGDEPGLGATTSNQRVAWSTFDELEVRFDGYEVFVSVTNGDNKVFERRAGNKPINAITLAQEVARHIASAIVIDNNGMITISGPFVYDSTLHPLDDDFAIMKHKVTGIKRSNFVITKYGYNDLANTYGLDTENQDLRQNTDIEFEELTFSFPFYKAGINDNQVQLVRDLFIDRIVRNPVQIEATIKRNFAITMIPTDRFQLDTATQPKLSGIFEVFKIGKGFEKEGKATLFKIQDNQIPEPKFCTFQFDLSEL